MDTIFMNSRNSKTSDPNRLLLNLSYEIYLKRSDKCYAWKNIKKLYKNKKFKISALMQNEEFELLTDHIQYQIFEIILGISTKTLKQ